MVKEPGEIRLKVQYWVVLQAGAGGRRPEAGERERAAAEREEREERRERSSKPLRTR